MADSCEPFNFVNSGRTRSWLIDELFLKDSSPVELACLLRDCAIIFSLLG